VVKTFTYLWKDYLQMCWAHDHKLHGLHTYHVHTPLARGERACASACVINCSIIYGRFLFGVNILQITTSSKGYDACASERATNDHKLHGIHTYHVKAPRVRVRACVCECTCASASVRACVFKRSLISERILSKFGENIQQISRGYMRYLICVRMHVVTARTSIHSRICQARDGQ
jgi:hypothetical protein